MMAASSADLPKLAITLPAHWARVHAERLLDDAVSAGASEGRAAEVDATQAALRTLLTLRALYRAAQIEFTAIRLRPDAGAIDLMTLAVPGQGDAFARDWTTSTSRRTELKEVVDIDGIEAISHRSMAARPGQDYNAFGSEVSLVFRIPSSDHGAIVTVVSTVVGCEDTLERDAEEIIRSMSLTSFCEAPMAEQSTRVKP
jgi:hypothetical protein